MIHGMFISVLPVHLYSTLSQPFSDPECTGTMLGIGELNSARFLYHITNLVPNNIQFSLFSHIIGSVPEFLFFYFYVLTVDLIGFT